MVCADPMTSVDAMARTSHDPGRPESLRRPMTFTDPMACNSLMTRHASLTTSTCTPRPPLGCSRPRPAASVPAQPRRGRRTCPESGPPPADTRRTPARGGRRGRAMGGPTLITLSPEQRPTPTIHFGVIFLIIVGLVIVVVLTGPFVVPCMRGCVAPDDLGRSPFPMGVLAPASVARDGVDGA